MFGVWHQTSHEHKHRAAECEHQAQTAVGPGQRRASWINGINRTAKKKNKNKERHKEQQEEEGRTRGGILIAAVMLLCSATRSRRCHKDGSSLQLGVVCAATALHRGPPSSVYNNGHWPRFTQISHHRLFEALLPPEDHRGALGHSFLLRLSKALLISGRVSTKAGQKEFLNSYFKSLILQTFPPTPSLCENVPTEHAWNSFYFFYSWMPTLQTLRHWIFVTAKWSHCPCLWRWFSGQPGAERTLFDLSLLWAFPFWD